MCGATHSWVQTPFCLHDGVGSSAKNNDFERRERKERCVLASWVPKKRVKLVQGSTLSVVRIRHDGPTDIWSMMARRPSGPSVAFRQYIRQNYSKFGSPCPVSSEWVESPGASASHKVPDVSEDTRERHVVHTAQLSPKRTPNFPDFTKKEKA